MNIFNYLWYESEELSYEEIDGCCLGVLSFGNHI